MGWKWVFYQVPHGCLRRQWDLVTLQKSQRENWQNEFKGSGCQRKKTWNVILRGCIWGREKIWSVAPDISLLGRAILLYCRQHEQKRNVSWIFGGADSIRVYIYKHCFSSHRPVKNPLNLTSLLTLFSFDMLLEWLRLIVCFWLQWFLFQYCYIESSTKKRDLESNSLSSLTNIFLSHWNIYISFEFLFSLNFFVFSFISHFHSFTFHCTLILSFFRWFFIISIFYRIFHVLSEVNTIDPIYEETIIKS